MNLRCDARLVEEHRDEVGVLGELGEQALRGDDAAESFIAHQPSDMDRGHATTRDLAMEDVASDRDRLAPSIGERLPGFCRVFCH